MSLNRKSNCRSSKESVNNQIANDKELSSSDLLCEKFENIKDDLIVGFSVKHKGNECSFIVRLDKKDQNWKKIFELIGTNGFMSGCLMGALKDHKFIQGNPFNSI